HTSAMSTSLQRSSVRACLRERDHQILNVPRSLRASRARPGRRMPRPFSFHFHRPLEVDAFRFRTIALTDGARLIGVAGFAKDPDSQGRQSAFVHLLPEELGAAMRTAIFELVDELARGTAVDEISIARVAGVQRAEFAMIPRNKSAWMVRHHWERVT